MELLKIVPYYLLHVPKSNPFVTYLYKDSLMIIFSLLFLHLQANDIYKEVSTSRSEFCGKYN